MLFITHYNKLNYITETKITSLRLLKPCSGTLIKLFFSVLFKTESFSCLMFSTKASLQMLGSMSGCNFNKIFFLVKNHNKNDLPLRNWKWMVKIVELTFEEIHFNYQFCCLSFSNSFTIVWQKNCSFINWKNRTFLNQKILWAF